MEIRKQKRLESILGDILARFFEEELDFPQEVFLSITRVQVSESGGNATIFVSIYPDKEREHLAKKLKKMENKASAFVRSRLRIKHAPQIRFALDRGEEMRDKIERILKGE